MLFLDGYAGAGAGLLDIRSQGYGDDDDWEGLTADDVLKDKDTAFVWSKWKPLELWLITRSVPDSKLPDIHASPYPRPSS
jgi:hypothetical protein